MTGEEWDELADNPPEAPPHIREEVWAWSSGFTAGVNAARNAVDPVDCTCGWGGVHDPDNPRCDANLEAHSS